jgi:hypothetical protein
LGKDLNFILRSNLVRSGLQGLWIAGAHGHAATFRRKSFRRSTANSLTGGGNQRDTICQT